MHQHWKYQQLNLWQSSRGKVLFACNHTYAIVTLLQGTSVMTIADLHPTNIWAEYCKVNTSRGASSVTRGIASHCYTGATVLTDPV